MADPPSKRRRLSPPEDADAPEAAAPPSQMPSQSQKRASWQSPTKASLARFNPSLLPRPSRTQSPEKSPRPAAAEPFARGGSNTGTPRGSASPQRRRSAALGGSFAAGALRRRSPADAQQRVAGASRSSAGAGADGQDVDKQLVVGELPGALFSVGGKPLGSQPRWAGGRYPAQPSQSKRPGRPLLPEPELPPTPEHLGLKPLPAQPQGLSLLSSSPTTRAYRRKGTVKSSPLKNKDPATAPQSNVDETVADKENAALEKGAEEPAEFVPEDPAILRQRDILRQLQEQLQLVSDDVAYLEKAAVSLHESNSVGSIAESKLMYVCIFFIITVALTNALRTLITTTDPEHKRHFRKPQVIPLSVRLAQFLPFSRPQRHQALLAQAAELETATATLHDAYRPVEAAQEARDLGIEPDLQITSRQHIVRESLSLDSVQTIRHISLGDPSRLLKMDLKATISTADETIHNLSIVYLSPWAEGELGTWARKTAPSGDISCICRAFAEYWRLSVLRAKTWAQCSADHSALLDESSSAQGPSDKTSRASVHVHLGRSILQLSRSGASLLIRWDIGLDWTGAAHSRVSASCALPAAWRDADVRGSFALVRPAFDHLVADSGVRAAVRVMVGLLLGDDG